MPADDMLAAYYLNGNFGSSPGRQLARRLDGPLDVEKAQLRAASDLSRLHNRVLGDANDDGRIPVVCGGVTTAHIFVGIFLEELDLTELFGDDCRNYCKRVSMIIPWRKSTWAKPFGSASDVTLP